MDLQIKNAILHVLKNDGTPSVFSENELDLDSEVCEAFIVKHIKKLLDNPAAKEACFKPEAALYAVMQSYKDGKIPFKGAAHQFAVRLSDILTRHVDIPQADILVVRFDIKNDCYLAVLKLNFKECFTHSASDNDNQLVKYNMVLPFDSGRVEEACLIPFEPMVVRVLEKPFTVDGQPVCYFSEMFLECETALSKKETVQIITEVAEEFVDEYFSGDASAMAMLKTALITEAENDEDGIVSMENVAETAFPEDETIKTQFVETLREAGLRADIPLGAKFARQQFGTQKIKADNGVEIKFPTTLASDSGAVEFTRHEDGTISVLFKRLRPVEKK